MRKKSNSLITAVALLAALVSNAGAAVIYYKDQDIPIPTSYEGVSVNLETTAVTNAVAGAPGADMNFVFGGAGITSDADETGTSPTWQPVRVGTANTDAVQNLALGTVVGPSSVVASDYGGSTTHFATFTSGSKGYIGFSVLLADNTTAYGWAEVTLQDDNTEGVIHGWAYDDTGATLAVGVPEPSHTLLAILSLSVLALRRRR
ncbi:MAG: hypothetical protein ACI8XO_000752 [Verrucomicrobiales bacterium]|jgi:hypothetical protein